jgi:hypothetical protein
MLHIVLMGLNLEVFCVHKWKYKVFLDFENDKHTYA